MPDLFESQLVMLLIACAGEVAAGFGEILEQLLTLRPQCRFRLGKQLRDFVPSFADKSRRLSAEPLEVKLDECFEVT